MRNKIIALILGLLPSFVTIGCDPHEDVYVPVEIKHQCNDEAEGSLKDYRFCLLRKGCKVKPDPMPLSETPVYICKASALANED